MHIKNRFVVAIIAFVLITGLATACSGGKGSPEPQPTSASPVVTAPPTARQPDQDPTPGAQRTSANVALDSVQSPGVADAPMPANPATYKTPRAVKIGEAVLLQNSGLIFQVSAVRTVPNDAKSEFVVADVVIGNTGEEEQTISSLMLFGIVADGWHWYGISLESIPQMVAMKLPMPFDADIAPGKAAKGSLPILVPKDAKGLTLSFQSMPAIVAEDPMVFVPLGIRGEGTLPWVEGKSPTVEMGRTYKVGESFTAPKRGLVVRVNGYWERTKSAGQARLESDEKFILVDVTAAPLSDGMELKRRSELSLLTADGETIGPSLEDGDVYRAESVEADNGAGRGVALFRAPKSVTGLKLSFEPIDPTASGFTFGSGEELAEEQAFIELSGGAMPVPAVLNELPEPAATATPAAPEAGDLGSVPAELKAIPVPEGFAVVKDSADRYADDGKFVRASVKYFGTADLEDVKEFFKESLTEPAGFVFYDEDLSSSGPDEGDLMFGYSKDGVEYGLSMYLINKAGGVEIELAMEAY